MLLSYIHPTRNCIRSGIRTLYKMAENGNKGGGDGRRGALIVLEGCDRTGKTTQAEMLVESLKKDGKPAIFMRFPERQTEIGGIISSYLSCGNDLEDHAIHLLFSANRWELVPKILSELKDGTSIIVDRYAFSGVAFSAAKKGMSLDWCKKSDVGLPKPDQVLFLNLSPEEAKRRGQFGEERYEKEEFQKRVYENYQLLQDDIWKIIDANKSIEDLQEVLKTEALKTIEDVKEQNKEIQQLWV
ncbi:thymidylate kinase-like isoform X2 [Penaeus japonicus]|uniref:thymidylate kinase-like isoform X2 n=1 Tax=Penaeus japonicus TaxID=27405 RepID=UPI001C70EA95|nr:thymidylate kinase-like isoform X2 [Penaeus japonicus]